MNGIVAYVWARFYLSVVLRRS